MRYARGRWEALARYLSMTAAWRSATTPPSVPSGPWPWAARTTCSRGSDAGGERAAAIYTLVETAKLNGLDPEAYLRDILGRIADHPINKIAELLPWNIAKDSAGRVAA